MRAVIQRVLESKVIINDSISGEINKGLTVFLGIGKDDDIKDIEYLIDKIFNLRIFEDENGKMNLSLLDINGEILIISQFTLFGDLKKGKRPSFTDAMPPSEAKSLYDLFIERAKNRYPVKLQTGEFQADMKVHIVNDGPVTILIDSKKTF